MLRGRSSGDPKEDSQPRKTTKGMSLPGEIRGLVMFPGTRLPKIW